jgi:branched-chain amino acid transport system substrate-binding protein
MLRSGGKGLGRGKARTLGKLSVYVVIAVMMLAAISIATQASAETPKQVIKIAFFQPRTAPALNFYGTWAIQGFHLGLEYATGDRKPENLKLLLDLKEATYTMQDGRKIVVKVFDTRGNTDAAIAKAKEAIEEWRADILAGESFSSVAAALASIAKQYGKLYFVVPAAAASITQDPVFSKYIFRVARSVEQDALAMTYYMVEIQGYKRFAFLAADYEFGWSFMESIQAALSRYPGTRIVSLEWAPLTTTDFKPYLLRVNGSRPDVIGIIWAGDFSLIIKDMAALNMLGRIPLASIMIDLYTTNYINFCIPGMEGSLENLSAVTYDAYRASQSPLYKTLEKMIREENIYPYDFLKGHACKALDRLSSARVPDLWHPPAFATAQFIVETIKAVPDLNIDRAIAFLEGLTMETPMGATTIRPNDHQALRPYYVVNMTVDKDPNSDTYGLIIGEYITTIPFEKVVPRVLTTYKPYPKTFSVSIKGPLIGRAPYTADLSASIEGGTPPYTCEWSIEGRSINGTSVAYTFTRPGLFNISVRCQDSIGLKAEAFSQIAIVRPEEITQPQTPAQVQPTSPRTTQIPETRTQHGFDITTIAVVIVMAIAIIVLIVLMLRRRSR